jgi:predicted dehydrogenase
MTEANPSEPEFDRHEFNRREFLGSSAKNAAGVAVGMVGLSGATAQATVPVSAGDRLAVGVVGVRGQGLTLATRLAAMPDVAVTTICDIDQRLLDEAATALEEGQGGLPRRESDFRRLLDDPTLDAIVVATPDHWHAPMAVQACLAGKDVYLESPVGHTIQEGWLLVNVARESGRVIQSGLQQRSGEHFRSAIEYVRGGKLGEVRLAKAWTVHRRKSIGFRADAKTPEHVDYAAWLGPAPLRPFNPNRFHRNWNWFWDYGCGELGKWGVQMIDIARWGLDVDWPRRVSSVGGKYHFNDDQETPDTQSVHYDFGGTSIVWEHRQWSNRGIEGRSAAVSFHGERGTLIVDRGGWKVYGAKDNVTADASDLLGPHLCDFIDAIRTRREPSADILTGHVSSGLCHLGNISHRLGREVTFDAATSSCNNDDAANALLTKPYRDGWTLPVV